MSKPQNPTKLVRVINALLISEETISKQR